MLLGSTNEEALTHFIARSGLTDGVDDTSNPILQGVNAIASLQLQGREASLLYKRRVMSLVKESEDWLDEQVLLRNLVATMLLYHYEVQQSISRVCITTRLRR